MRIAVVDTETTGLDRATDHVVEICIRDYEKPTENVKLWRVRPPIPIPKKISDIHKITDADVFHAPSFGEIADEVAAVLADTEVIVGYNPDFDIAMLTREFKLAVVDVRWPKIVICAKRLWDQHQPIKRSLSDAYCEFVSPEGFEGAHGALADTLATYKVLAGQLERFQLKDKDWKDLDPERLKWCGPSNHVIWNDTRDTLLINFGKFDKKSLAEVEGRYLAYLIEKDFPPHVKELAEQAQNLLRQRHLDTNMKNAQLASWAREQKL